MVDRIKCQAATFVIGLAIMGLGTVARGAGVLAIDDFDSYDTTSGNDLGAIVAPGIWYTGTNITVVQPNGEAPGTSKHVGFGWTNGERGGRRDLPVGTQLADGQSGVYFLRVRQDNGFAAGGYAVYGLSYLTAGSTNIDRILSNYEVLVGINDSNNLAAGNGSTTLTDLGFATTATNWVNVWLEVDNATDTFNVYANTDTLTGDPGFPAAGDLLASNYGFVNGSSTQTVQSFLMTGSHVDTSNSTAFVDDILMVVPEPASLTLLLLAVSLGLARRCPRRRSAA